MDATTRQMLRFLDRNRTYAVGDVTIETWYDRASRNWITTRKDSLGNQIGDAVITGNKASAAHAHDAAITEETLNHGR